jgi:hypothetical protein
MDPRKEEVSVMAENSEKTATKQRGKPFPKGQTGNPGGRPKRTEQEFELIAACKDKTPDALNVLEEIMRNGENERNRFAAALAIIERAHGKPVQPTELKAAISVSNLTDEQLALIAASRSE